MFILIDFLLRLEVGFFLIFLWFIGILNGLYIPSFYFSISFLSVLYCSYKVDKYLSRSEVLWTLKIWKHNLSYDLYCLRGLLGCKLSSFIPRNSKGVTIYERTWEKRHQINLSIPNTYSSSLYSQNMQVSKP